jgi:hypothetical protein
MATTVNDLILVHIDSKPGFYARVDEITPDVKPGWWQVKLLVLCMPLQVYTWILEESQINGAPFTMGGTPIMMEKVVSPVIVGEKKASSDIDTSSPSSSPENGKTKGAKVLSLCDKRKR